MNNLPPKPENPVPASITPGYRLLLVEDHDDTRKSLEYLLKKHKFNVTSAASAAEALQCAARQSFDLVITDLGLPDLHGCELMKELQAKHGLRGIATTGYGMEQDIERCRASGFSKHLTKPINLQQLRSTIDELLKVQPAA